MAEPTAQSSINIAAPPELVYEIVSDIEKLPDWAAETYRCTWLGGASGPAVGAKFRGMNENKGRRWPTTCIVTDADAGKRFAFKVHGVPGITTAQWRYDIEPTDGGCRVTESTRRVSPRLATNVFNRLAVRVEDRDGHNQRNIEHTLAQLKEYAEKAAAQ